MTLDELARLPRVARQCACGTTFEVFEMFATEGAKCAGCEERDRLAEERERARRAVVEHALATIPDMYRWATFDAPELGKRVKDPRALVAARAATDAQRIVFLGPAGAGKTVLETCLLRAWADRGLYVTFVDALALSQARAHHSLGTEAPLVVSAMRANVLALDDLGQDKPLHNSAVGDVIFERHQRMRRTIVTSGFTQAQLTDRYGDGIARRLFEGATIIELRPTRRGTT